MSNAKDTMLLALALASACETSAVHLERERKLIDGVPDGCPIPRASVETLFAVVTNMVDATRALLNAALAGAPVPPAATASEAVPADAAPTPPPAPEATPTQPELATAADVPTVPSVPADPLDQPTA